MRAARIRMLIAVPVMALAPVAPAAAQSTLYDNGVDFTNVGMNTAEFMWAQDFTLGGPSTVRGLRFAFSGWPPTSPVAVSWQIRAHDGGPPGLVLHSGSGTALYDGPATSSWSDIGIYDLETDPLGLDGGAYWLAITSASGRYWMSTTDPEQGDRDYGPWYTADGGTTWTPHGVEGQFSIHGDLATPEPVTMVLLGSGLAGVAAAHRRRRSSGRRSDGSASGVPGL